MNKKIENHQKSQKDFCDFINNKKIFLLLLMIVLVIPFVSAKIFGNFDVGNIFSSARGFAIDNWNPNILWVIGGIVFVGFVVVGVRNRANVARTERMIRESEGGFGAITGAVYGGRKVIGLLRGYKAKRQEEREIEERLTTAEQQLEKYETYLVWQEEALERRIIEKEAYISNLVHIEQNMINELRVLSEEFDRINGYLQTTNMVQLIARATEIRNRIKLCLERIIRVAELIRQQIKEQEEIEQRELVAEEKSKSLEKMRQGVLFKEMQEIEKERVTDKQAESVEGKSAVGKTKKAERKAKKEERLIQKEFKFEERKKRRTKKSQRKTEEQLAIDKQREEALIKIEKIAAAIIQTPNIPTKFLRDNLSDINNAMKILLPKKNILFRGAKKIHKLHEGLIQLNRRDLKIETKRRRLAELADKLFEKGERRQEKQDARIMKLGKREMRAAA